MSWGKYKGRRLGEIPDDYWIWFLNQEWCNDWPLHVTYANYCFDSPNSCYDYEDDDE